MPELAEVETVRRALDHALKGKRIRSAVPDLTDLIVYDRAPPSEVGKALEGARVIGTGRRGKYFWIELDRRPWPVIHLGMSGNVLFKKAVSSKTAKASKKPKASKKDAPSHASAWGGGKLWSERGADPEKRLWFCRLLITADDGTEVAITDPRRFGRIRLAQDPSKEAPISKLGPDPLDQDFSTLAQLRDLFAKRKIPIKTLLLNQAHFAGVGNWLADEILFQSRISPHRAASSLRADEVRRLRTKLLLVIHKAVAVGADHERFPAGWLFHTRWGRAQDARVRGGHLIRHDEIHGRTAAWVPKLQS